MAKWLAKLTAPNRVAAISTASMAGESKKAMLASWVEKPPREKADMAWHTASNQPMPAHFKPMQVSRVKLRYTSQRRLAVCEMRGAILLSLSMPGISALNSCVPPTPNMGRMATARTMMPMPPSQFIMCRQKLSDGASVSRLDMTVAPVVVRPLTASKKASV